MADVTPGFVFSASTPVNATNLNLLGQPTVSVGDNEVTLAMMATLSSNNLLLGRSTTGSGDVQAIDLTTTGLGFYAGAGGTITQQTDKTTTVVLSKMVGQITTNNASLNDATTVSFTVTNTKVATTDLPLVVHSSGGTAGAYIVWTNAVGSGSFKVSIRNVSGGSLGEALVLTMIILKGVTS